MCLMTEKLKRFIKDYKVGDTVFRDNTILAIHNEDPSRCWVVVAYKGDIPHVYSIDEFYKKEDIEVKYKKLLAEQERINDELRILRMKLQ